MIDREQLIKIAKSYGIRPWQQERHYIQALILLTLSEKPLIFKGDTYLWFFHGLNRFSEDLDFTATGNISEDTEKEVSDSLKVFGVENSIKPIMKNEGGFSFRINAKGPLNTSSIDLCHVYVEISKREKVQRTPISVQLNFEAYATPVKIISGMSLDEVAAEKLRAIITRQKPRDAYDLFYLVERKGTRFDRILVDEKMKYYQMQFSDKLFKEKLLEKKTDWEDELKQLVFGKLPDFETVRRSLEKWVLE